jgi:hypothetical protein
MPHPTPNPQTVLIQCLSRDSRDRFTYFPRSEKEHLDPALQEFSSHGHSSRAAHSRAIPLINLEFGAIFLARSTDPILPLKGNTSC